MTSTAGRDYGMRPEWRPGRPRIRARRLLLQWVDERPRALHRRDDRAGREHRRPARRAAGGGADRRPQRLLPPLVAALRLPYMLAVGFLLVLVLDALMVMLAASLSDNIFTVDSFFAALLTSLVAAAVTVALEVVLGTNDDDVYSLRVTQRIARRSRDRVVTDVPGIIYLEIDGLARPVLQRAMRDGHAPEMARWLAAGSHRLSEWETDLSSQTGASQSGLLLGSNDDIPAFRWVEKESGRIMTCSAPADCALIEERHSTGHGLLAGGGASRSNLLSGDADHVILTVSRMEAEKKANPGYRAYLADGYNVTRTFVLFFYEVVLEWTAAVRQRRRDVQPRGHRPLKYAFVRAGLSVFVRDFTVYSIISDMMMGVPAVYACFAGYDEVAHHSGLERDDAMEVLRKLDQQFGRIARAREYAARPYEIVVLSDHGQTQGATFKQRNGYGLDDLVERNLQRRGRDRPGGRRRERHRRGQGACARPPAAKQKAAAKNEVGDRKVVVMGSGNLGLIYLMDEPRRLTLEEIDERHPRPAAGAPRASARRLAAGALRGARRRRAGRSRRQLPLRGPRRGRRPAGAVLPDRGGSPAAHRRLRARRRHHGEQLLRRAARRRLRLRGAHLVPRRHGRPADQTVPAASGGAAAPDEPIIGAEAAHRVLAGWRHRLQGGA